MGCEWRVKPKLTCYLQCGIPAPCNTPVIFRLTPVNASIAIPTWMYYLHLTTSHRWNGTEQQPAATAEKNEREPEKHRVKYTNTQNTRAFAGNNDDNETKLYSRVAFFFLLSSFPFVRLRVASSHRTGDIAITMLCRVWGNTLHSQIRQTPATEPVCMRKVVKMDSLM